MSNATDFYLFLTCSDRLIRTASKSQKLPKRVDWASRQDKSLYPFIKTIEVGAQRATVEIESVSPSLELRKTQEKEVKNSKPNFAISFRASLSGARFSFIDSAPSEIFLASLTNVNVIGSYDTLHRADSTFYLTLADLQVDNMVPNAPFLVAFSRLETTRPSGKTEEGIETRKPPLIVAGLSLAPQHESGVVVRSTFTLQSCAYPLSPVC